MGVPGFGLSPPVRFYDSVPRNPSFIIFLAGDVRSWYFFYTIEYPALQGLRRNELRY